MKIFLNIVLLFTLMALLPSTSKPQSQDNPDKGSPEWIVKRFFVDTSFSESHQYVGTFEFDYITENPSSGEMFPHELSRTYRLLRRDSTTAVYSIAYSDSIHTMDVYCHLYVEKGMWKIQAIRSLALTGIYAMIVEQYKDSIIADLPDSVLFSLEMSRLVISSDSTLKAYLLDNLEQFQEMAELMLQPGGPGTAYYNSYTRTYNQPDSLQERQVIKLLNDLYCSSAERWGQGITIILGGILDNSVGYMFVPDGQSPPKMHPDNYIYIEKILPNWYIYKTT